MSEKGMLCAPAAVRVKLVAFLSTQGVSQSLAMPPASTRVGSGDTTESDGNDDDDDDARTDTPLMPTTPVKGAVESGIVCSGDVDKLHDAHTGTALMYQSPLGLMEPRRVSSDDARVSKEESSSDDYEESSSDDCEEESSSDDCEEESSSDEVSVVNAKTVAMADTYTQKRKNVMAAVLSIDNSSHSSPVETNKKAKNKKFDEKAFAALLRSGARRHILFHKEIRNFAVKAGMDRMPNATIEEYVFKIFCLRAYKPSKIVDGKQVQGLGFRNLRFAKAASKGQPLLSAARQTPSPQLKQAALQEDVPCAQVKQVFSSDWQKGAMGMIRNSLGTEISSLEALYSVGSGDPIDTPFVGMVLSKNRQNNTIIGRVIPGAAYSPNIKVGHELAYHCIEKVDGREETHNIQNSTLAEICKLIRADPSRDVKIHFTVAKCKAFYGLLRRHPVGLPLKTPLLQDKIFFYGGTQVDRDSCIRFLQREHASYNILTAESTLSKIADIYCKSKVEKSVVVMEFDEVTDFASDLSQRVVVQNQKTQKTALDVARCLGKGRFWHQKRGTVVFDPPTHMFVFCNVQPHDRNEWDGWIFYHVSDKLA